MQLYLLSLPGAVSGGLSAVTTLTTFVGGWILEKITDKKKKKWLVAAVLLLNFGMLAVLKYSNFVILNFNRITGGHLSFLELALPLGISFYTFQSMGICWMYTGSDARRRKILFGLPCLFPFSRIFSRGPSGVIQTGMPAL